jgi:hypothetical protein
LRACAAPLRPGLPQQVRRPERRPRPIHAQTACASSVQPLSLSWMNFRLNRLYSPLLVYSLAVWATAPPTGYSLERISRCARSLLSGYGADALLILHVCDPYQRPKGQIPVGLWRMSPMRCQSKWNWVSNTVPRRPDRKISVVLSSGPACVSKDTLSLRHCCLLGHHPVKPSLVSVRARLG